eukprot:UN01356
MKFKLGGIFREGFVIRPRMKKKKLFLLTELFGSQFKQVGPQIKYVKDRLLEKCVFPPELDRGNN